MRIFTGAFGLVIIVLVLSFALSNKQDVPVVLWPFEEKIQAPLYAIVFVPLAFGFFAGSLQGWLGGLSHRIKARRVNKELLDIKKKLGDIHLANLKAKKSFWRRP